MSGVRAPLGSPCCVLEQDIFTPPPSPKKVLVIPRKRWLRPNMTEKLLTGTLSIKQKKKKKHCVFCFSPASALLYFEFCSLFTELPFGICELAVRYAVPQLNLPVLGTHCVSPSPTHVISPLSRAESKFNSNT